MKPLKGIKQPLKILNQPECVLQRLDNLGFDLWVFRPKKICLIDLFNACRGGVKGRMAHGRPPSHPEALAISRENRRNFRTNPGGAQTASSATLQKPPTSAYPRTRARPGLLAEELHAHPPQTPMPALDRALRQVEPLAKSVPSPLTLPAFRPASVILGYWREVLAIEENAAILNVAYVEAA